MTFRLAPLLLLFLSLYAIPAFSKNTHYDVVNYNTDNGLPQNSISGIQFDRKGYCWLGTQMGLVRFDGQRFSLFGSDNMKGLRSDRIFNVTKDKAGDVLVCTGGIIDILKINDSPSMIASEPVLLQKSAYAVPTQGFAAPVIPESAIKQGSPFQVTLGTATGNMYLVQNDGSYYITPQQKLPIRFNGPYERHRLLLVGESLVALQYGNKAAVWTKEAEQPAPELCGPLWTDPDFVKGDFIALTSTEGAYICAGSAFYRLSLEGQKLNSERVLENIEIPSASALYFDKQNHKYYIGSAVSGLYVITPADFYTPPTPAKAINQGFYSQSLTDEGILSQRFLFRKDGSNKEYPLIPHLKATWYNAATRSLYYAPDLTLMRVDLSTGKARALTRLRTNLSAIFPEPGQKEHLVYSTSFFMGKIAHDTLLGEKRIPGLSKGQEVFAAYPAGADTFLLATWSGVKWYDYRNNRIYRSVLDSLTVRQLYVENTRRIWIASYGKGWYLYNKGHIARMPDGPLDALKTVNAIIDDGRGCFWLSSNNGLFKVSRKALTDYAAGVTKEVYYYAFTTKDHLPTNEFNACNPSYVWLPDSMLSLPSLKGLVWFYPHKVHLSLPDKGIYIEQIRMNEQNLPPQGGTLLLPPDHGRLNVVVSSPYFGNKENMQLRFRIEGLEEEWHAVPENGDIIIDRLPAGTFSLLVTKATGMASGEAIRIRLAIRVSPFWYHTRLFYVCLSILLAIFVYWLIKLRTRLLQARNRKLKTQVVLQTRDLNRMVRQLTQSEEALRQSNLTKDNIITTVLHDLRSPIRFIYAISKHVASGYRGMQQDALDAHLQELKSSTASLNNFTDQFFIWALSQHRAFAAKYSLESLQEIFREIKRLYADIVIANGNRLSIKPTALSCYTDPQLLSIVIRNLLDNANKYTSNGMITLAASRSKDKVVITINDTGNGFKPAALKAFLDKDKSDPRSGSGSAIILNLLGLIGGSLEAVSEPGKGTAFKIILPHQDADPGNKPNG